MPVPTANKQCLATGIANKPSNRPATLSGKAEGKQISIFTVIRQQLPFLNNSEQPIDEPDVTVSEFGIRKFPPTILKFVYELVFRENSDFEGNNKDSFNIEDY